MPPCRLAVAIALLALLAASAGDAAPLPSGIVSMDDFGAKGDGSDDTAAFAALNVYLRAHDGTTVLFPGKTYAYSDNRWLQGVRNVRLIGSGAKLKCTSPQRPWDSDPIALFVNGDYFTEGTGRQPSHRVATVAAGKSVVSPLTASDAAEYQAGDWILVYGYAIYPGGWPPSARYHEIQKVKVVDARAGTVTLARPLRNAYDQRWYDARGPSPVGAPRILRLSRRAGFTLSEDVYIEGFEFLKGPHEAPYFSAYDRGAVYASGALSITLVRCKLGNLDPTTVERFLAIDSEIDVVEVDKIVGVAAFERCRIGVLVGGTGADTVTVRDSDLLERIQMDAQTVTLDNNNVYATDPVNHFAIVNVDALSVALRNNKIWRRAGDGFSVFGGGRVPLKLTVARATAGSIRVAFDPATLQPFPLLYLGARLYAETSPVNDGTISAIYYDPAGPYAVIEADFRTPPRRGDVFLAQKCRQFFASGNVDLHGNEIAQPMQTAFPQRPDATRNDVDYAGRTGQMVVPFPRGDGNNVAMVPGYLRKITISVIDPVEGTRIHVFPTGGSFWSQVVSSAVPGVREIDYFSVRGPQTGDGIGPLSQQNVVYDQINYGYEPGRNRPPYPRGYLIFEFVRPY